MKALSAQRAPSQVSAKARASWISLFAMLMMFIGPLVSQSMPMDHKMAAMPMEHAAPSMEHGAQGEDHDQGAGSSELHVLLEKCGYCSLFFHCPALPQAKGLAGVQPQRPTVSYFILPHPGHATQAVFPGARTRAPPSLA
jgi:hypothetical protein